MPIDLMLIISGVETITWIRQHGEGRTRHSDESAILHDELGISCHREAFLPGEYVFPFSYQLQPTLPGVFNCRTEVPAACGTFEPK